MTTTPGRAIFRSGDGSAAVIASGEIDVSSSAEMRDLIDRMIDRGESEVVVDLTAVSFIDSSGLAVLVAANKRAVEQGTTIRVVGLQPGPRKIFEITGLLEVFSAD